MDNNLYFSWPDQSKVEEWEREVQDEMWRDGWIEPDYSVEMFLLDNLHSVSGTSFERLRPQLEDLEFMAVFRDVGQEEVYESLSDPDVAGKMHRLHMSYGRGKWNMRDYTEDRMKALPRDVNLYYRFADPEIENLHSVISDVENVERSLIESDEMTPLQFELSAAAEGGDPVEVAQDLNATLSMDIHFLYGDEDVLEEYRGLLEEEGVEYNRPGVPGAVKLGEGEASVVFPYEDEMDIEKGEVEQKVFK